MKPPQAEGEEALARGNSGSAEELTDAQVEWQTKMDNLKQQMHGQSDEFIRDIFALVVKPVIMGKVLPLVDKACKALLSGLTPKDRVTISKFKATMA